MSEPTSELVAIARLNGNFRKNYGKLIGALLYMRSVSAVCGRSSLWTGPLFAASSAVLGWFERYAFTWLRGG
jgi:hypothetical protein